MMEGSNSNIENSGNSQVNVHVNVDTSSLAYAMMCYWHTSGMITDKQFTHMLTNYNHILGKDASFPDLLSNMKDFSSFIREKK